MNRQLNDGWYLSDNRDFAVGTDITVRHSDTDSIYLKSVVARPKTFGFVSKTIEPPALKQAPLRFSAWVKTMLPDGASVQLWLRVERDGCSYAADSQLFDSLGASNICDLRASERTPAGNLDSRIR